MQEVSQKISMQRCQGAIRYSGITIMSCDVNIRVDFPFEFNISSVDAAFQRKKCQSIPFVQLTIFFRLERHHDSTCSVHQAPSDVQVLCQHDLEMIGTSVLVNRSRGHLERRHVRYLSSHFELDNSPHGGVSINSLHQNRVAV